MEKNYSHDTHENKKLINILSGIAFLTISTLGNPVFAKSHFDSNYYIDDLAPNLQKTNKFVVQFWKSIKNGDLKGIDNALKKGVSPDSIKINGESGMEDQSALMYASKIGNLETIKFLIKKGANINYKNNFGSNALSEAVQSENIEVLKYLLENGADFNIINFNGYSLEELTDNPKIKQIIMDWRKGQNI